MLARVTYTSIEGIETTYEKRNLPDGLSKGAVFALPSQWFGENVTNGKDFEAVYDPLVFKVEVTDVQEAKPNEQLPHFELRQISAPAPPDGPISLPV